jgi:hypothetical protein
VKEVWAAFNQFDPVRGLTRFAKSVAVDLFELRQVRQYEGKS